MRKKIILFLLVLLILIPAWKICADQSTSADMYYNYGLENEIIVTSTNPEKIGSIIIRLSTSPVWDGEFYAEFMLVDPCGRRTGYDPDTGEIYNEISQSYYETINFGDMETGEVSRVKELGHNLQIVEEYKIKVIGLGDGEYTLSYTFSSDNYTENRDFEDISITPGEIHEYTLDFILEKEE